VKTADNPRGDEPVRIETNKLDTDLLLKLYASVGWEPPCREQVEKALQNTTAAFTAYDHDEAIGMVRLIGGGGMSFYIKDFAVVPRHQCKGAGGLLLTAVESYIRDTVGDWAVSLELISTIEAQPFYEKMGFEARPCEWDGPGMFKMIR